MPHWSCDMHTPGYNVEHKQWRVYFLIRRRPIVLTDYFDICKNEEDARRLARELNKGKRFCLGFKKLGTGCNNCIRCELVEM